MLQALKSAGVRLGVCTSKPEDYCDVLLRHHGIEQYFDIKAAATRDGTRSAKKEVSKHTLTYINVYFTYIYMHMHIDTCNTRSFTPTNPEDYCDVLLRHRGIEQYFDRQRRM